MPPIPLHPPHPIISLPLSPSAIQAAIDSIALKNDQIKLQRKGEKDHGIPEEIEGKRCLWCDVELPEEARVLQPGNSKITVVCSDCRCNRIAAKKSAQAISTQCGRIRHVVPGTGEMHRYCYDCWLTNLRSSQKWYLKRKLEDDANSALVESPSRSSRSSRNKAAGEERRKIRGGSAKMEVDELDDGDEERDEVGSGSGSGGSASGRGSELELEQEEGEPRSRKIKRKRTAAESSGDGDGDGTTSGSGSGAAVASTQKTNGRGTKFMSREEKERSRAGKEVRRLQAEELIRAQMQEQLGGLLPPLAGYEGVDRRGFGFGPAPPGQEGKVVKGTKRSKGVAVQKGRFKRADKAEQDDADMDSNGDGSCRSDDQLEEDELDEMQEKSQLRAGQPYDLESLPGLSDEEEPEFKVDSGTKPEVRQPLKPPEGTPSRRASSRVVKPYAPGVTPSPTTAQIRTSSRKAAILAKAAIAGPEKIIPAVTVPPVLARAEKLAKQLATGDKDKEKKEDLKPMTELERMAAGAVAAGAQIRLAMGLQPRAISPPKKEKKLKAKLTKAEIFAPVPADLVRQKSSATITPNTSTTHRSTRLSAIAPAPATAASAASQALLSKLRWEQANPESKSPLAIAAAEKAAMAMAVTRAANAVLNETAEPSASASSALGAKARRKDADKLEDESRRHPAFRTSGREVEIVPRPPTVYQPDEFVEAERRKAAKRNKNLHTPTAPSAYPGYHNGHGPPSYPQPSQMPSGYPSQPSTAYPGYSYPHPSYPSAPNYYGHGSPYAYGAPSQAQPGSYPHAGYPGYTASPYPAPLRSSRSAAGPAYPPGYPHPSSAYPGYSDTAYPGYVPSPYGYYGPPPPTPRSSANYAASSGYPADYSDPRLAYSSHYGYSPPQDSQPIPSSRSHGSRSSYGGNGYPRSNTHAPSCPKLKQASSSRRESYSQTHRPASILPSTNAYGQSSYASPALPRRRSRNPDSETDSGSDPSEDERDRSRRRARAAQTAHSASIAHAQALAATKGSGSAFPSSPPPTGEIKLNGKGKQAESVYPPSPGAGGGGLAEGVNAHGWQDMPFNTGGGDNDDEMESDA